jgi:DNA-binding beta-propeller fold protein YncE
MRPGGPGGWACRSSEVSAVGSKFLSALFVAALTALALASGSSAGAATPAPATFAKTPASGLSSFATSTWSASNATVTDTLTLGNGSEVPGNYLPPNVDSPIQTLYDSNADAVLSVGGNSIAVINGSTWSITREVDLTSVQYVQWGVFDPLTDLAYLAEWDASGSVGTMSQLNVSTGQFTTQDFGDFRVVTLAVGVGGQFLFETAAACCGTSYALNSYNVSSERRSGETFLPGSSSPGPMAYAGSSQELFVTLPGSNSVQIVNASNTTGLPIVANVSIPDPVDAVYDARDDMVYIASGTDGNLTGINATSNSIETQDAAVNDSVSLAYDSADDVVVVSLSNESVAFVNGSTGQADRFESISSELSYGAFLINGPAYDSAQDTVALPADQGELLEIDPLNGSTLSSLWTGGLNPNAVTVDPVDGDLYVDDSTGFYGYGDAPELEILNATGGPAAAWISMAPFASFFDPLNNAMIVQLWNGLAIVNASTNRFIDNFTTVGEPNQQADSGTYDSNSRDLFVLEQIPGGTMVFNASTLAYVRTLAYGGSAVAAVPSLQRVFIVGGANRVSVINSSTMELVSNVTTRSNCAPTDLAYDPTNGVVYVANSACPYVSRFNASTLEVLSDISVPAALQSITYDPAIGGIIATSPEYNEAYVVADANNSFAATLGVGAFPTSSTYDGANGLAYVANNEQETISVVRPCPAVSCLELTSFKASPSTFTLGADVTFTAHTADGTGNLTWSYRGLPAGCASKNASRLTCTPTAPGSSTVSVTVTDSTGTSARASVRIDVLAPRPEIYSFTASPSSFWIGNSTTINVSAGGGYGWLSYSYFGLPAGCASQNASNFTCTPTQTGTFPISVNVTNAYQANSTENASMTVQALPAPIVSEFSVSAPQIYLGGDVSFSVNATGGYGWLAYAYSGLPTGCASANESTLACTPDETGSFTVAVNVTNSFEQTTRANASFSIVADPVPVIYSFVATPSSVYLGNSTVLIADAVPWSSGSGWLNFSYSGLPAGCRSANVTELTCRSLVVGSYSVELTVRNAFGQTADADAALDVAPDPAPSISSFAPASPSIYLGQPLDLVVVATGGYGWLTYQYSVLPPGCADANLSTLDCVPTEVGDYTVQVNVTNAFGVVASAHASVVIEAVPVSSSGAPSTDVWLAAAAVGGVALVCAGALLAVRRRRRGRGPSPPEQ